MLEVPTGCGAETLAVPIERSAVEIHAADVSAAGPRWARRNHRTPGTRVRFCRGSLLELFTPSFWRQAAIVAGTCHTTPYAGPGRNGDTPGGILGCRLPH